MIILYTLLLFLSTLFIIFFNFLIIFLCQNHKIKTPKVFTRFRVKLLELVSYYLFFYNLNELIFCFVSVSSGLVLKLGYILELAYHHFATVLNKLVLKQELLLAWIGVQFRYCVKWTGSKTRHIFLGIVI